MSVYANSHYGHVLCMYYCWWPYVKETVTVADPRGEGSTGERCPRSPPNNHAHYQQPCNLVWKLISDHRVAMATLSYFTEYRLKNTLAIFKTHNEASPGSNDLCTILTYTYCHMISFAHEKTEYDICVPLFCFFLTLPEFSVTCQ